MLLEVARFVLDMKAGSQPRWLSLVGKSGTGKTMLAKRVWRWFNETGRNRAVSKDNGNNIIYGGEFCFWPNMADSLKANSGYELLDDMKKANFVIVDDIGQNRDTTGHATEKLSILLSNRVGKWTIITSNLSVKEIADKLDPRISSRMLRDGSAVVDIKCQDYNLRVKPALNTTQQPAEKT